MGDLAVDLLPAAPGLSDLPEEAVMKIVRQLDARQLASLVVQDRRLRALGSDAALWQALAQERWPGCSVEHYGGDWPLLYRTRAALPSDLVRAADRCHAFTLRASNGSVRLNSASLRGPGSPVDGPRSAPGSPSKANVYGFNSAPHCSLTGMLLEEAMQAAFTMGLAMAAVGKAALAGCPEVSRFREDVTWWLTNRPEVVVRFVRRTGDALREYDMWGSGYSSWPDVPWRRSAVQFVLDMALGPHSGVCVSVIDRLQREADVVDGAIRKLQGEPCHLDVRRPMGVPRSHWWYFMAGGCR